jgi:hypothetical protein
LNASSNIIRVIKLRRMRWAGHVSTHGWDEKCIQNLGQKTWKDCTEDLHVNERTTLQWILGKQDGKVWTGFIWLRIGTIGRLLWTLTSQGLSSMELAYIFVYKQDIHIEHVHSIHINKTMHSNANLICNHTNFWHDTDSQPSSAWGAYNKFYIISCTLFHPFPPILCYLSTKFNKPKKSSKVSKIHCNIIPLCTPISSKWSLSF